MNPPQLPPEQNPEDFMQPSEMATLQRGPMGPLVDAVNNKMPILIALRSNRKLYGYPKAIDRHWNMILESCYEIWSAEPREGRPARTQTRFFSRLFLRGDNVVCVYPNPKRVPDLTPPPAIE